MINVCMIGRLGSDAEEKVNKNGGKYIAFSLACSPRKDVTIWVHCQGNKDVLDNVVQYLKKGKGVCVVGELSAPSVYERNGEPTASLSAWVKSVSFLPGGEQKKEEQGSQVSQRGRGGAVQDDDDGIPF